MSESANKSEIARFKEQVALEYTAAQQGLCGLAYGTTKHAFITARMQCIAAYYEALKGLVGEQEAVRVLVEAIEEAGDGKE